MKQLLNTIKEKWAEYILEIIVIVLSIFGALELENWNSKRIDQHKEVEILEDLRTELLSDLEFNLWTRDLNNQSRKSMQIISKSLQEDLPYHDSLDMHFGLATFIVYPKLNGSVFETLKSEGLDLITNKTLRDSIVFIYGWRRQWIADQRSNYHDFMMDAAMNVFNTRFDEFWNADLNNTSSSKMVPLEYEALKTDQKYLYIINSLPNINFFYVDWPSQESIKDIRTLLKLIDQELIELDR